MMEAIKQKLNLIFETIRAFFQEGNPAGSSKRLIAIVSFFSGIGISWASLLFGFPITDNILYLTVSIIGLSTGNYIWGSKKNFKEKIEGAESKDKDVSNGQG